MARRGRKRKQGQRKPSGDLRKPEKQEKGESAQVIALTQPHRKLAPIEMSDDQRAESPLGCLYLIGAISSSQYAAARRFARLAALYLRQIQAPRHSPPSIAGAFEPRRAGKAEDEDCRFEYEQACRALDLAGRSAANAVYNMAVIGQSCPPKGLPGVIRGLEKLETHFDRIDRFTPLTEGNKSATVGNTG